jgi:nucleotide-binding universal stress UspA family protein
MAFRKILLPTDLSSEGERAFAAVQELVRERGGSVVLLHVIENAGAPPLGKGFPRPPLLAGTAQEIERAQAYLAERRGRFGSVEVTTEVLVAPSVPHAISDYAQQNGCDAIALSTHGRSGFRRLIIGSVAESVLRQARVPVIAFPRQE